MMNTCKLYLFGTPRLEQQDRPILIALRKAVALLVYLAVTRQPHSRDALATLLWPENNQTGARANLRRTLYDLSQLLGPSLSDQLLVIEAETVSLRTDAPLWLDTVYFQQTLSTHLSPERATQAVDEATLSALTTAADLYTADFLAGFTLPDCPDFADWQFFQSEELRHACLRLLQRLVIIFTEQEKFDDAIRYARRWLQLDPHDEAVHRQLMRLYALTGQPAAALRQYEECVRLLSTALDAKPSAETTALYNVIRVRRFPTPEQKTGRQEEKKGSAQAEEITHATLLVSPSSCLPAFSTPPHNLPTQNTPFVGRAQEVTEICQRLADPACRLLTLVGPGGIGKTRLALAVAQQILDSASTLPDNPKSKIQNPNCKDGVFFVPLQPLRAVSEIAPAMAAAIGFQFHGSAPPQQQLLDYLQHKELLLVLDNFEHLLEGVDLLTVILTRAPGVKLLVTAREALKLQEEWFHPLAGMQLPPLRPAGIAQAQANERADGFANYDAVQLFMQTARRATANFQPAEQAASIIRICRLVDGMPLALELAALWLKVLTCAQVADEIERGIDILTARHQNVPERQRSIRVIFDQTWRQLTSREQQVLAALSVFRGPWDETAAATVASATPFLLVGLTERGLLQMTTTTPVRYTLHELIRQYAASKLQEEPATATSVVERHGRYYADLLRRLEGTFRTADSAAAYQEVQHAWTNVVAAWEWATDHGSAAILDGFVNSLGHFHQANNWFVDGCHFLQPAITRLQTEATTDPAGTAVLAKLLGWQGDFYLVLDQTERGEACLLQALALVQQVDQPATKARILGKLADFAHSRNDRARARSWAHEALAIYEQLGDEIGVGWLLIRLGKFALDANDFPLAHERFLAALQLCRKHQFHANTSIILGYLGRMALQTGAADAALRYFQEALQAHERAGGAYFREELVEGLGAVAAVQGDYARAQHYYEQALRFCRESGGASDVAHALVQLAELARKQGDYTAAHRDLAEARELHQQVGELRGLANVYYRLGLLAQSEGVYATAAEHFNTSLHLFTDLAAPLGQAQARQGLGQIAQAWGKHDQAYDHYHAALCLALPLDAQPFILDLLVSLADHWLATGRTVDACILLLFVGRQGAATYESRAKAQALLGQPGSVTPDLITQAQQQVAGKPTINQILEAMELVL
ncbi:MAG: tetratricopeptide repeat protein [Caldilinea sp. CFX5]|nr:tetratricopeptide repeat protein [Caldilinea sp. CFX5]